MIIPGTKVSTTYQHSETGVICKPTRAQLPKPGPDWYIIKFDLDGGKLYIHRSMFNVAN